MHQNKEDLYTLVKDIISKSEFEKKIHECIEENEGLFDENTAALLLVDKLGRNKQCVTSISDLKPDMDCTIFGKVTHIMKTNHFTRKNGSNGRVANLEIADQTGSCRLVLWNEDVELTKNIHPGTLVKIVNGYTKDGFTGGVEIHIGKWGKAIVDPEDTPPELKTNDVQASSSHKKKEITGEICEIQPSRAFFKEDGEFGFVTNITIKNQHEGSQQLTLWGTKVKEIQDLTIGEHIKISNVSLRQKNGGTEIHIDENSVIQKA